MNWREVFTSIDWIIVACAMLLALTGLAMFFSATNTGAPVSPLFIRQGITAVAGLILLLLISRIPYHSFKRYVPMLYALGIVALFGVSLTGRIIRGTISRFELLGFQLQPSEFVKVVVVLMIAWIFARGGQSVSGKKFLASLIFIGIPLVLVASEPDIGMAALMIIIWAGSILFLGLPWRYVIALSLIGLVAAGLAWQFLLLDYQKARLANFLDPTRDPLGSGYNVSQSIVALGSGQFFGRGLGHGPQSQLKFLPERHTDFILASIGEELGFVGVSLVLLLYLVMLWRILVVAQRTKDTFGQLIAIGTFWAFTGSIVVSAGMNMGLLPVTGIPLSLVSYGGSNLIATCLLLGLVQSVKVHSRFAQNAPLEISYIT